MELIDQINQWLQPSIDYITPHVQSVWAIFSDYTVLRAAVLMLIGFLFAKFLSNYIPKKIVLLLDRLRLPLGSGIKKLLRPLIFKIVLLASIAIIAGVSGLSESLNHIIQSTVKSLIILFVILFINDLLKLILQHLSKAESKGDEPNLIRPATLPLFENVAAIVLILLAVQQIFGVWNVDMTALLASAGLVGLAIGMASKDTLSDIIAGVLILVDRPYSVGDIIQIDKETRGKVIQVGIRTTRIQRKDNVQIIIPNDIMGRAQVVNESSSKNGILRIRLLITTAYGADSNHIRSLLIKAAGNTEIILQDQKTFVHLSDIQKTHTTFSLFCWITDPADKFKALAALRENVYHIFLEEKVDIALPEGRNVAITSQADGVSKISITEIPDLFGGGKPRTITQLGK